MKRMLLLPVLVLLAVPTLAVAQSPEGKTLAATMNIHVFPTEGQTSEVQSADEAECYNWAVQNTGTDPFDLAKQVQEQQAQAEAAQKQIDESGKGAAAKGAVGGAAAGAVVGAVAGDAKKGAAIGAAAGGVGARRQAKKGKQEASQQVEQQEQQAKQSAANEMENFKKAFSVCLEAKNYMVKY